MTAHAGEPGPVRQSEIQRVVEAIRRTREFQAAAAFGLPLDAHDDYLTAIALAATRAVRHG